MLMDGVWKCSCILFCLLFLVFRLGWCLKLVVGLVRMCLVLGLSELLFER